MSLDIREGDSLVVGDKTYPISSCAEWRWDGDAFAGALGFALIEASTKRQAPLDKTTGKRGAAVTHLTGLWCTPLDPQAPDLSTRERLSSGARELLQTIVDGGDVFYALTLEDLKP
jgi:hypothetical protein